MSPLVLETGDDLVMPEISILNKYVPSNRALPLMILTMTWRSHYGDFRDALRDEGFVVVKNAIPRANAIEYQNRAYDWVRTFNTPLDFHDPDTWIKENIPLTNRANAFAAYCVSHEKFMWEARMEPGVLSAFGKLWGTDELLTSFDGLNITFPNRKDVPAREPWEHVDQSPSKRGAHCIQGIIHLSPSGLDDGGLVLIPKSHRYHDEFFDTHPRKSFNGRDVYLFTEQELSWFKDKGLYPHKVCCEPGDLIMWDSRVIHYGSDPTERSTQIRTAIYATYMPARLANKDQLEIKRNVFEHFGSATHWPFEHMKPGPTHAILPDGSRDPRDRDEPIDPPVLSDKLLRLAGMKA